MTERATEKEMATGTGRHIQDLLPFQRLDGGGQTALVASRLVLVDDLLVGNAVDGSHRLAENLLGGCLVAGGNRLAHALDGGAQLGALAEIAGAALNRLAGAFTGLCGIGHVTLLRAWKRGAF